MMAKRAKADAQDVKNRYATKILRGWEAIELYAGESRKTLLYNRHPAQVASGGALICLPRFLFCVLIFFLVDIFMRLSVFKKCSFDLDF